MNYGIDKVYFSREKMACIVESYLKEKVLKSDDFIVSSEKKHMPELEYGCDFYIFTLKN